MSKKLEEKQARREAEERRAAERKRAARNRSLITLSAATVVAVLVVFLIMNERNQEESGSAGVSRAAAGCDEVETHEAGERDHVEEGTLIEYTESPPTSGPHYAQQSQPGFFSSPIEPQRLVHNLEHGQVVVWFSPDAPQATVDAIESAVDEDPVSLLATPYDDMPSGSDVVFTAWAASQSCADFSSQVFDDFRERFQGRGPEPVGIPTFDGN